MSAIGNCPWCGDPDPIVRTAGIIAVYCTNLDCVADGPIASTPDLAITAWNRLAARNHAVGLALIELIAQCKATLEALHPEAGLPDNDVARLYSAMMEKLA